MRRRVGLGAIQKQQQLEANFKEKSDEISKEQMQKLSAQIDVFRDHLQKFATKHRSEIKKNSEFRRQFQEMCATVGVDPLQSSNNFWTKLLGVGDFYYELAVQIIEVCMSTSSQNGGLISLNDLLRRLKISRGNRGSKQEEIIKDDVLRAINKLDILGGGVKVIRVGKDYIIQSVAKELSFDHTALLQLAESNKGKIYRDLIVEKLNWNQQRIKKTLDELLMEGFIWIDEQAGVTGPWYWFPSLY